MQDEQTRIAIFGTPEKPAPAKTVRVGDLSLVLDGESIRSIVWQGVEVVRGITWPIRDKGWMTLPPQVAWEKLESDDDRANYELVFGIADGALSGKLHASFSATGTVDAKLELTAHAEFQTNRAGFTLLHPLEGVAGRPVVVRHSGGYEERSLFPEHIAPDQPATDIVGMRHEIGGVTVDITFVGDLFEMEDQRNWTDASYKTYCRPLTIPLTYTIAKGETVKQAIVVSISGSSAAQREVNHGGISFARDGDFPQIALAIEAGWLPAESNIGIIANTGVKLLQLRTGPEHDQAFLEDAGKLGSALQAGYDLEVVIPNNVEPEAALRGVADALASANINPERVIALPEPYLKSYQPSGPWPEGPTPSDCTKAARSAFPDARIGGGALTNFTEFNRCRPDPTLCDYVSHSTTAIVHAADDRSVSETIEALRHVFTSAAQLAGGNGYRLGLVSIGMRSNPYGAEVAENPDQIRRAMAMHDPRQRGLYAAAFAVAALGATQSFSVEAVALAAPAGPFGIVAEPQEWRRPYFDAHTDAKLHPLFHVVKAVAAMSGRPRLMIAGLAPSVAAIGAVNDRKARLVLANLGEQPSTIALPAGAAARIMDVESFDAAVRDPHWLENSRAYRRTHLELGYCAVAFVDGTAL
jgi:D-apionolactonase